MIVEINEADRVEFVEAGCYVDVVDQRYEEQPEIGMVLEIRSNGVPVWHGTIIGWEIGSERMITGERPEVE